MAPKASASSVFTEFETNGWSTVGLACLVGLNGPVPYLSGADSSVHLSEELKNAAWALPRSMVATAVSNYITAFLVVGTCLRRHLFIDRCLSVVMGSHSDVLHWQCRVCTGLTYRSTVYRCRAQCDTVGCSRKGAYSCYSHTGRDLLYQWRHDNFKTALVSPNSSFHLLERGLNNELGPLPATVVFHSAHGYPKFGVAGTCRCHRSTMKAL